jgi:hypothetical protein
LLRLCHRRRKARKKTTDPEKDARPDGKTQEMEEITSDEVYLGNVHVEGLSI